MKLLLLSNSTNSGENFLEYAVETLREFLGNIPKKIVFIPFASVRFSFDQYEEKVQETFRGLGQDIVSIHHFQNPIQKILEADTIVTGGGNTFNLLHFLQKFQLINPIRQKILEGTSYIGWSAGSNICCPTICTTNDMPIIQTSGFEALNLIPFQINPHYSNYIQPGHGGESRDQRIEEYLIANPLNLVVGLPEGTILRLSMEKLELLGDKPMKIFSFRHEPVFVNGSDDISYLMKP